MRRWANKAKMEEITRKQLEEVCCERFYEAYLAGEICYAYEKSQEIDETEWYVNELWHLYYCPF